MNELSQKSPEEPATDLNEESPSTETASNVDGSTEPKNTAPAGVKIPTNWDEIGLSSAVLEVIENEGYKTPTQVQALSIPVILEGHDVIVSSETGSGKTASFALPMIEKFKGREGTYGIVLAPTREIALQTQAVFEKLGGPLGIRSISLIGGVEMSKDKAALDTYPHVIVATPGRLCDQIERGNVWLDFIQMLVLDEADRMLDMGFSDQLNKILKEIPADRQALVFSATFSGSVGNLVSRITKNYKRITIGKASAPPKLIEQRLFWMDDSDKLDALLRIIREEPGAIFIFTRSKDRASRLWQSLHSRTIYDATFIHSDCTQAHREQAIKDFKAGKYRILVATDVAGRGIDVDDVAHTVNFDLPMEADDYIHRIGRTGRKGKTGIATTFATFRDRDIVRQIEKLVGKTFTPPPARAPGQGSGGGRPPQDSRRGGGSRGRNDRSRSGGGGGNGGARRTPANRGPAGNNGGHQG